MKPIKPLDLSLEYEHMKKDIDEAIERCLKHQHWILGPEVGELESALSDRLNVRHAIGTSSGTDALVLSLRALSIKHFEKEFFTPDQLIVTTPFTFVATADAIIRAGASVAFVDIDLASFNMDVDKLAGFLHENQNRNIVGILPVHLYGQSCEMTKIMELAHHYDLFVLEDAAQAYGGMWKDSHLGSIGDAGAFSFFPSKNLGGFGDGGLVTTNDDETAEIVRALVKHGGRDKYNVDHIGYNARLDTFQASILLAKLKYIDDLLERRRHIASIYNQILVNPGNLILPETDSNALHAFNQYTIRTTSDDRDELKDFLAKSNIASTVYYPVPLHKMKAFRDIHPVSLPVSEVASQSVLSLPMEPLYSNEVFEFVGETILKFSTQD